MMCPACCGDTRIINSRHYRTLVTRRRRECVEAGCGRRFTTEERVVEGAQRLRRAVAK